MFSSVSLLSFLAVTARELVGKDDSDFAEVGWTRGPAKYICNAQSQRERDTDRRQPKQTNTCKSFRVSFLSRVSDSVVRSCLKIQTGFADTYPYANMRHVPTSAHGHGPNRNTPPDTRARCVPSFSGAQQAHTAGPTVTHTLEACPSY